MIGFLVGLVAGNLLRSQAPATRRNLALVLVAGERIATTAVKEVQRAASRAAEELEDIVAEAQAGRSRER